MVHHTDSEPYVHLITSDETASTAIIEAVSHVRACSPFDLEPLYQHIDPDALNTLISHRSDGVEPQIEFVFGGCDVAVTPDAVRVAADAVE